MKLLEKRAQSKILILLLQLMKFQKVSIGKKGFFLKERSQFTAPPKNHKPGKYKYYAENFSDNPLGPIDSSQKASCLSNKKNIHLSEIQPREKAAQNLLEPKEKKKSQGKKKFS
jgi:hypothetical protein